MDALDWECCWLTSCQRARCGAEERKFEIRLTDHKHQVLGFQFPVPGGWQMELEWKYVAASDPKQTSLLTCDSCSSQETKEEKKGKRSHIHTTAEGNTFKHTIALSPAVCEPPSVPSSTAHPADPAWFDFGGSASLLLVFGAYQSVDIACI